MKKKEQTNQTEFSGTIQYVSCSPHGDPEGIVLDDGTFVKVPPHSLRDKESFRDGIEVTGFGVLLTKEPNRVFHHAKVQIGERILSDDSGLKEERDYLKERHKKELEKRKDSPSEKMELKGKIVAVGTKPKGEVDRLILDDGTSVHLPKEVKLDARAVRIGDTFKIVGEARRYKHLRFLKAESVRPEKS
jgi:hypothetical protein